MKRLDSNILGVGVVSAIAASLCCIVPLAALLAGTSGFAANMSWIEPLRPILIGITIVALGYAWYRQLKTSKQDAECCEPPNSTFLRSRNFLGLVTLFSVLMLSFPLYADKLYLKKPGEALEEYGDLMRVEFQIDGMTCSGCEGHVEHAVSQLDGIAEVKASYLQKGAFVQFDPTITNLESIKEAILSTSYQVEGHTITEKD